MEKIFGGGAGGKCQGRKAVDFSARVRGYGTSVLDHGNGVLEGGTSVLL